MKIARMLVAVAVFISLSGVLIHIGALFAGLSWLTFFNAPATVVESYQSGTWLAPVSCLIIAGLMGACAYWAASTLAWVRRPPLQSAGLAAMATVCIVRALLLPVLAVSHPELRNTFEVVAAVIWGLAGAGFAVALTLASKKACVRDRPEVALGRLLRLPRRRRISRHVESREHSDRRPNKVPLQ